MSEWSQETQPTLSHSQCSVHPQVHAVAVLVLWGVRQALIGQQVIISPLGQPDAGVHAQALVAPVQKENQHRHSQTNGAEIRQEYWQTHLKQIKKN